MAKDKIFLVYSCDIWKSKDSMRLLMCTSSPQKLESCIVKKIMNDDFYYGYGGEQSCSESAAMFKKDLDAAATIAYINDHLDYGFVDYCYDGEEI